MQFAVHITPNAFEFKRWGLALAFQEKAFKLLWHFNLDGVMICVLSRLQEVQYSIPGSDFKNPLKKLMICLTGIINIKYILLPNFVEFGMKEFRIFIAGKKKKVLVACKTLRKNIYFIYCSVRKTSTRQNINRPAPII